MKKSLLLLLLLSASAAAQENFVSWDAPGAGNPFLPGYFADPTIRKFGDTYYLYATTDGNGNGYGPAQVWMSEDFRNWTNMTMTWPTTEVVWAPDVLQARDGSYRYFYCQPCVLHEGCGPTPRGPWANVLGEDDAVLVPDRFVTNAITLDGQTFTDDDGSTYIYFGTWGIYDGFGCGVARMGDDLKSFTDKRLIPNTEVKDFFEAPFVMKRNGVYYFMYSSGSCHDHTYRVQYATSTAGPMGPYEYRGCILETNADLTVHGPGHHSILQDGDEYYIVYHRHNIPRSTHGFHRQVCIDRLVFNADGSIAKVVPTHGGMLPRSVAGMPVTTNLAFRAKATASSFYSNDFRPAYATDDNNATLWKPATCNGQDWLQIDLGQETTFDQVWTQFEYATYFYQYKIETSHDGSQWTLYADKTRNTLAASPFVDRGACTARYLRITVTGRQKNGHFGGIWNVKVLRAGARRTPPQLQVAVVGSAGPEAEGGIDGTPSAASWENTAGMLGGRFERQPDGRMRATFSTGFLFAKGQTFTIAYRQHGKSIAYISDGKQQRLYTDGHDMGKSKKRWADTLTVDADITDLRIFSYALHPSELDYYALHPVVQALPDVAPGIAPPSSVPYAAESQQPKPTAKQPPLVSISANDYAVGTSLTSIANHPGGSFRGDLPLQVELIQGRQAFRFTGRQLLRSDFPMPATLTYSAPYTVSAWVLNPQVERIECIAQLMPVRHDLSTVELCNGSDPQNGLVMHNASFENSGSPLIKERQGQWQHWTVTYDGYIERHYLDGQLAGEKNMMLLLRPQPFMQIGASFDGSNPFDGYLHSLQVYDRTLTAPEVRALYEQPTESPVLYLLQPADTAFSHSHQVRPCQGKLAVIGPFEIAPLSRHAAAITIAFALRKGARRVNLLKAPGVHIEATPKGIIINDTLPPAPILLPSLSHPSQGPEQAGPARGWNLLTLTADGQCWLNGKPLWPSPLSPLPSPFQGNNLYTPLSLGEGSGVRLSPLTIGDAKAAIAHLLITAKAGQSVVGGLPADVNGDGTIAQADALKAYADFTTPSAATAPSLTAKPITPQMLRLATTAPPSAGLRYSFTLTSSRTHRATPYSADSSVLIPIDGNATYTAQAAALDSHGNVALSPPLTLTVHDSTFTTTADDFDNYVEGDLQSPLADGWHLLKGPKATHAKATVAHGQLTLQSANGNFNAHSDDNAILLFREVTGDFVVQGRLTGLMGSDRHDTPAYNEGGLIVLDDSRPHDQHIIQAGIFPSYNCGNMLTTVSRHGQRPQFPTGNGWHYEPYLQIERQGSTFHVRTSNDGTHWHPAPGSPVHMPDISDQATLKAGFFQVTYTDRLGSATFDNFRLWKPAEAVTPAPRSSPAP